MRPIAEFRNENSRVGRARLLPSRKGATTSLRARIHKLQMTGFSTVNLCLSQHKRDVLRKSIACMLYRLL